MVSATDQMRQQLAELMGSAGLEAHELPRIHYTDETVCKSFLLTCCPHDILNGTRMDIGPCAKVHNLALRADYENAVSRGKDYYYDVDAMEHLERFIGECDKRTELAKRKLAEQQEDLTIEQTTKVNNIHAMAEKIGKKLAEAEAAGSAGDVDRSMRLFKDVEELKVDKRRLEDDYKNSMPASTFQQQKLRVCDVCSAYLGLYDNDRRLADHFGGKLHLGFITLRDKLEDLRLSAIAKRNYREAEKLRDRAQMYTEKKDVREAGVRMDYDYEREALSERAREAPGKAVQPQAREKTRDGDKDGKGASRSHSRSRSRSPEKTRRRRRSRSRSYERRHHSRSSKRRSRERRRRRRSTSSSASG